MGECINIGSTAKVCVKDSAKLDKKGIKHLGRSELLEMLLEYSKENEKLQNQLADMEKTVRSMNYDGENYYRNGSCNSDAGNETFEESKRDGGDSVGSPETYSNTVGTETSPKVFSRQTNEAVKIIERPENAINNDPDCTSRSRQNYVHQSNPIYTHNKGQEYAPNYGGYGTEISRQSKPYEYNAECCTDDRKKQRRYGRVFDVTSDFIGLFEAAEASCARYAENVEDLCNEQKRIKEQQIAEAKGEADRLMLAARERCAMMQIRTQRECEAKLEETDRLIEEKWSVLSERLAAFYESHQGLLELVGEGLSIIPKRGIGHGAQKKAQTGKNCNG